MDHSEDMKEFLELIQKVKEEELKKQQLKKSKTNQLGDEAIIQAVSIIQPIVETFAKSDSLLQIQKTPTKRFTGYDLVYANIKNLSLSISGSDSYIEIHAVMSDTVNNESLSVYSGAYDEEQIKKSVQETLLKWYRMLKSSHVKWRREN